MAESPIYQLKSRTPQRVTFDDEDSSACSKLAAENTSHESKSHVLRSGRDEIKGRKFPENNQTSETFGQRSLLTSDEKNKSFFSEKLRRWRKNAKDRPGITVSSIDYRHMESSQSAIFTGKNTSKINSGELSESGHRKISFAGIHECCQKGNTIDKFSPAQMTSAPAWPTLTHAELSSCLAKRRQELSFFQKPVNGEPIYPPLKFDRFYDSRIGPSGRILECAPKPALDSNVSMLYRDPSPPKPSVSASTSKTAVPESNEPRSVYLRVARPLDEEAILKSLSTNSPDFDIVQVPIVRKWYGPSDMHYAFLKFVPLAAAAMLLSIIFVVWGAVNIGLSSRGGPNWDQIGDIVVGIFKILIGLAGIGAVLLRLSVLMHFLSVGYNVFLVSQCVKLIMNWLEWGLAMGGATTDNHIPWTPTSGEWAYMIWQCILFIMILLLSFFFVFGLIASMKMILAVGGTGWEKATYLEVLESQEHHKHQEKEKEIDNGDNNIKLKRVYSHDDSKVEDNEASSDAPDDDTSRTLRAGAFNHDYCLT